MPDIDGLVNDVERAPDGPQVGAFFDFDGTLIDGYSAKVYFQDRISPATSAARARPDRGRGLNVEAGTRRHPPDGARGRRAGRPHHGGHGRLRRQAVPATKIAGMVYPDARVLLDAHRRKGHTSRSRRPRRRSRRAAALDLGIDHVLGTEVDAPGGILNGRVSGRALGRGQGRRRPLFAAGRGIDLTSRSPTATAARTSRSSRRSGDHARSTRTATSSSPRTPGAGGSPG